MLAVMAALPDAFFPSPLPELGAVPTRASMIVESLKLAIFSRQLKPGQILVERKIAEQLGVSKTPIREALIVLQRSGLLAMKGRSIAVRSLSLTDIRHVYEERVLLEPWAVLDAARFDTQFEEAGQALADAREHAAVGDQVARALANRRFHRGMYASSENNFIVQALDRLQDLTALAVVGVLWEHWPIGDIEAAEHEAIYEAARIGDANAASALMRDHIAASINRVAKRERREH